MELYYTDSNMNANEAKQIADSLNQDNTSEMDEILNAISIAAYDGRYYYDCVLGQKLSLKTITELQAKGFLITTSGNETRISWE